MEENPFDLRLNFAPSQNYEEDNPFDRYFERENKKREELLKGILKSVSEKDPEKTGEAQRLSKELNLPDGISLDSDHALNILKQKKQEQYIEKKRLAQTNPILLKQLNDPTFAALAYDDIPNLDKFPNFFDNILAIPENISQGLEAGKLDHEIGQLGYLLKDGFLNYDLPDGFAEFVTGGNFIGDKDQIRELIKQKQLRRNELAADGSGFIEGSATFIGQQWQTIPTALAFGVAAGKAGKSDPRLSALTFAGGFATKFALDANIVNQGHAYLEYINTPGIDEEQAAIYSEAVGILNAGLEFIGFKFATAPARQFVKNRILKAGGAKVAKELTKPTFKSAYTQYGKQVLSSILAEANTEVGQEAVQILGLELSKKFSEAELESLLASPEGWNEIGSRLGTTWLETVKGMTLLGLVGGSGNFYVNISDAKKSIKETAVIEKINEEAKNSKVRKRNPDKFESYIQEIADGKEISDFYIDATIFNQQLNENGLNIEQLELILPDVAKNLKDINESGGVGDVEIPTGQYAAKLAGTNFGEIIKPHLRPFKKSKSQTEATVILQQQEIEKAQFKELMAKQAEATQKLQTETTEIKNNIKEQLKNTKLYTPKQVELLSTLPRDFISTLAKDLNMSPTDVFKKYFYNIQSTGNLGLPTRSLFDQNGKVKINSPEFKNFFGKSKLKNSDGTPQVVYHGTVDSIDKFDLDHPNRYDAGYLGTGVYLTNNKSLAQIYARNKQSKVNRGELTSDNTGPQIMELYARLENPYRATMQEKLAIREGGRAASDAFRDRLEAEGYDGAIMPVLDGEEIVVFDPKAVKSINNSGTWSQETDNLFKQDLQLFEQKTKEQPKGKPIPQNILELGKLVNSFDFAGEKQYATNRDFKIALQQRINDAAKQAGVNLSQFTVEVEKHLVRNLLADAKFALETNPNAVGWYNEKVTKALSVLSLVHPEIATNPQAKFAFTWALANTSNGLKVDKNFELAEQAYAFYSQNGVMPTDIGIGDASAAINNNMKLFNKLMEEKGFEEFESFMKTMHTVKDVEAFTGSTVSGENKTEMVYGAAVMGPKIGNGFFANLYGQFEQLTMDRWLMRTWGRMTGTLITDYKRQAKTKREQLKPLIKGLSLKDKKAFEQIIGIKIKLSNLDEVAVAIQKASMKPANRKAMAQIATIEDTANAELITSVLGKPKKNIERIGIGDELRKGGNGLAKFIDGQKEAPSGPVERRQIRKVFNQALNLLQQNEKSLTMADLQALVWYPEKRLYDSAKLNEAEQTTGYQDNEAPDYANAAVNLAQQLGVSDADIQTTLQEVDLELERQAIERTRRSKSGEGTGGVVQRDNIETDETTGLPINPDGTVTVYHHTNKRAADNIRKSSELRSVGEPDVYVTTRSIPDTGYGDTAVAIRVKPSRLSLDDEFPNGRRDFRLSVGKPRGSIRVEVGEYSEDFAKQSQIFSQQQVPDGSRGGFDPTTLTTLLTQDADISTFFHETAHYMLSVYEDLAGLETTPTKIKNDFQKLLDFFGVENLETWNKLSLEQKRKYHESFAYNYEIYLFEGKAPSTKLQSLFTRFSNFLAKIYKSIRDELNIIYKQENGVDLPILNDEIRGVMDRMIASEEAISQANQVFEMKALFQTQEDSGMNDAEWADYTQTLKEADEKSIEELNKASMRQMKWLENARSKVLKNLQRKNKGLYQKIKEEETIKASQLKAYKLASFLRLGETINENGEKILIKENNKIAVDSLQRLVPFYDMKAEIQQLRRLRMVAKKGTPVAVIAEMFGYNSSLEMINVLLDLQPIGQFIKEKTDARMLEEYSGLLDPREQELQVQEVLHNEARSRFISVELRTLSKSMQPVRSQIAAAKQVAQEVLSKKTLRDIRPSKFSQAEAKAVKLTEAAMKQGDTALAIQYKRSQLLNNQLTKEAIEIHRQYDKALIDFKKFFKSEKKLANTRNTDMINVGKTILSSYKLGPKVENPRVYIEKLQEYNPDLYRELSPILDAQINDTNKDIKDLTAADFNDLVEVIESLWFQSKRANLYVLDGKRMEVDAVVDEIIEVADRIPRQKEVGVTEAATKLDDLHRKLQNQKSRLKRTEHWCDESDGANIKGGGLGDVVLRRKGMVAGPFTRYIFRPVKDKLNEYRQLQVKYTKKYAEMLAELDFGNERIHSNELNYNFGKDSQGRGKVELLGAMLHIGNKSNLKKLLLGRKWGELNDDGTLNTTRWDAFVERMENEGYLTKNDYDFLQKVWDLTEQMKPLAQKAHKDIFGYYFKEIEATPITTRFGTYRGGYVPAKVDPRIVKDAERNAKLDELRSEFKASLPSTGKGFTETRVEYNKKLSLHLNAMVKHIDDVLRFATVQPVIEDVLKIIKNKKFSNTINAIDGSKIDYMLLPWLNTAARQQTMLRGQNDLMDGLFKYVKGSFGRATMFGNFQNAVQQFTGWSPSLIKVERSHLWSGFLKYYKNPREAAENIARLSPFMADRQKNQMFDIQETLNDLIINPNKFAKTRAWLTQNAYFIQQAFQNQVDSVTWIGSYNQFMANKPQELTETQAQKEAIAQADANVRLTQDSLQPEDRAAFQTDIPLVQSMLQFTNYFNTMANLNRTQYKKQIRDMGFKPFGKGSQQLLYTFMFGLYIPAVVSGIIVQAFGGNLNDADEDGWIDEVAELLLLEPLRFGLAFVPGGNILPVPFNVLNDKPYDDRITTSPAISSIESSTTGSVRAFRAFLDPNEEVTGKNVRDVFTLLSLLSNYPLTIIGRPFSYLQDVSTGRVTPEGPLDFIRGVATGKSGRRSRN